MKRAVAVGMEHARLATAPVIASLEKLVSLSSAIVAVGHIGISDCAISEVSYRNQLRLATD